MQAIAGQFLGSCFDSGESPEIKSCCRYTFHVFFLKSTPNKTVLRALERIARGDGPETCAMMLGYSGWGAGQLEEEMKSGSWIPVDLDYSLIFETPIDQRWKAALASLGIDPARVIDSQIASA